MLHTFSMNSNITFDSNLLSDKSLKSQHIIGWAFDFEQNYFQKMNDSLNIKCDNYIITIIKNDDTIIARGVLLVKSHVALLFKYQYEGNSTKLYYYFPKESTELKLTYCKSDLAYVMHVFDYYVLPRQLDVFESPDDDFIQCMSKYRFYEREKIDSLIASRIEHWKTFDSEEDFKPALIGKPPPR